MADTKLSALTALTAITGDDGLYIVDDMDGTPVSKSATAAVLRDFTGMAYAAYSTDADLAAAVNTLYVADISGFTADRNLTLPATAAVGDRVGLFISTGDDAYEFIVKANTGDTLNGVTAAEWSRLFITGEVIIMRCIEANTAWVVEQDGRIPQTGEMSLTADCDGESANTTTLPTAASTPGTWTVDTASTRGTGYTEATGRFTVRRAGTYTLTAGGRQKDNAASGNQIYVVHILKDGTSLRSTSALSTSSAAGTTTSTVSVGAVDAYYQMAYATGAGSLGCRGTAGLCFLILSEVL